MSQYNKVMNPLARQFFIGKKEPSFQEILFLEEEAKYKWEDLIQKAPLLPRGWFELSRVCAQDRVEFTRDFWLDRIPYHPIAHPMIFEFFEMLDDISVVLLRPRAEEVMRAELVYSFADNSTFFRGQPPASEESLANLKEEIGVNLPYDFLSFARIHSGFGKLSEMGLLEVEEIGAAKRRVIELLLHTERRVKSGKNEIDPRSLIPFYEALGLSSFQCFYTDWYPGSEMGNVYLSGIDYTLSDLTDRKSWTENLAFPTFSEWLAYYLQGMSLCI